MVDHFFFHHPRVKRHATWADFMTWYRNTVSVIMPTPEQVAAADSEQAALRSIRALQGAPLEGCNNDDCDDCYPK
jgi:hypothetical protein